MSTQGAIRREELETWSRDRLIEHAKKLDASNAARLTKAELVDEILLLEAPDRGAPELSVLRGLFGRARDLLASVVEKKLHLPETADLLRAIPIETPVEPTKPRAVPTVTLAEIYAAQGHKERAITTLQEVLEREPEHMIAEEMLGRIHTAKLDPPPLPPEEEVSAAFSDAESDDAYAREPLAGHASTVSGDAIDPLSEIVRARASAGDEAPIVIHDAPLPEKYDVDECVALPVDPRTLYVYWEVREETRSYFERIRPGGTLTLRVLVIQPGWDGPDSSTRDIEVYSNLGDYFLRDLPESAVTRVAIGWKRDEAFLPVAHSPLLEQASDSPSDKSATELVRWTLRGTFPVSEEDSDAQTIQHAIVRREERRLKMLGSSRSA